MKKRYQELPYRSKIQREQVELAKVIKELEETIAVTKEQINILTVGEK